VSNSTLLRSEKQQGVCGRDRGGFFKLAAGVIGGTASASMLKAHSQQSLSTPARLFDGFMLLKVQTTSATINVDSGGHGPPGGHFLPEDNTRGDAGRIAGVPEIVISCEGT
jgi:hypothetical protein